MYRKVAIAIETSGRDGSAALCIDDAVVCEEVFPQGMRHASGLMVAIDRMCKTHGVRPTDLNELYVSIGPGSFTGLRVGVTAAKTIAWATKAKIVTVPSLRVIAENAPTHAIDIAVMLDAKRGQVFGERFTRGHFDQAGPGRLITPDALLSEKPNPTLVMGIHLPQQPGITIADESLWQGRAAVVARLGIARATGDQYVDAMKLVPVYIRIPEPEEKRLAAGGATIKSTKT